MREGRSGWWQPALSFTHKVTFRDECPGLENHSVVQDGKLGCLAVSKGAAWVHWRITRLLEDGPARCGYFVMRSLFVSADVLGADRQRGTALSWLNEAHGSLVPLSVRPSQKCFRDWIAGGALSAIQPNPTRSRLDLRRPELWNTLKGEGRLRSFTVVDGC